VAVCVCFCDSIFIFFNSSFPHDKRLAGITVSRLCKEQVLRKVAQKWWNCAWLAYGDSAQTHTALAVQKIVSTNSLVMASPYPNLVTKVVWPLSLPGVAGILTTGASLTGTIADRLYTIPCQFQLCFQQVRKCCSRCITRNGTTYLIS
jgi:hypothetical protein